MTRLLAHIADDTLVAIENLVEALAVDVSWANLGSPGAVEKDAIQLGDTLVVVEAFVSDFGGYPHIAYCVQGALVEGDVSLALLKAAELV